MKSITTRPEPTTNVPDLTKRGSRSLIFVFGSNTRGVHGAGAARTALLSYGAELGRGFGHVGESFAIPTKDDNIETLPLETIQHYVQAFLNYAYLHPDLEFQVTQIGCGLAGLKPEQIAPMFKGAPDNCSFDEKWKRWLGDKVKYWGTF